MKLAAGIASCSLALLLVGCGHRRTTTELGTVTLPLAKWEAAGSVAAPRYVSHTFALGNGEVLVFGGLDSGSSPRAAAELYDPVKRAFTAVGSSHSYVAADAFLIDAKVFLPGGEGGQTFDPVAHTWSAPDAGARTQARAVELGDGRILVMGGHDNTKTPDIVATCRIYTPGGTWSDAASMGTARSYFGAVTLVDGRVLVSGGLGPGGAFISSAELFDPTVGTWSPAAPMAIPRDTHALTNLNNGKVLAVGGGFSSPSTTTEIYDPTANTWSQGPALSVARSQIPVVRFNDGKLLLPGGEIAANAATTLVEILDQTTMTVSTTAPLGTARVNHAAALLKDGHVLVVGGGDRSSGPAVYYSTSEVYVPDDGDAGVSDGGDPDGEMDSEPDSEEFDTGTWDTAPIDPTDPPMVSGPFQPCTNDGECASGFCTDGVCCNKRCHEICHTCALPSMPGTCITSPAGLDLREECGKGASCTSTCGPKGACVTAQAGSQCEPAKCTGPSAGRGPIVCAKAGAACDETAGIAFDCAPYACEQAFGACRTTCTSSAHCAPGFNCDPTAQRCVKAPESDDGGCAVSSGTGTRTRSSIPQTLPALLGSILALGLLRTARRNGRVRRK